MLSVDRCVICTSFSIAVAALNKIGPNYIVNLIDFAISFALINLRKALLKCSDPCTVSLQSLEINRRVITACYKDSSWREIVKN